MIKASMHIVMIASLYCVGFGALLCVENSFYPTDVYSTFDSFCQEKFGAKQEPLVYRHIGEQPLIKGVPFIYESATSVCIGLETNYPCTFTIRYGKGDTSDQMKKSNGRFHYVHLIHLTALQKKTQYSYTIDVVDERGTEQSSAPSNFSTGSEEDYIRIPEDMPNVNPPYVLNEAGASYLVTRDIVSNGSLFEINADNIKLDLGGHDLVYNNKHWGKIDGDFWDYIRHSKFGVKVMKKKDVTIINGSITQGSGQDHAESSGIGYNPLYLNGCARPKIQGLIIRYAGVQQNGVYFHWGGNQAEVSHNIFEDHGRELINRHGAGCKAVQFYGGGGANSVSHHNLVRRTRQGGVSGAHVYSNEIYIDSWATNSFGVSLKTKGQAHDNRVFGTGYHVVGFSWGTDLVFRDNFIHLEGQRPDDRFKEFGDQISLNGFRLTQYAGSKKQMENNLYERNTVIVTALGGSETRGVQFFSDPYVKNTIFQNNIVKALSRDEQSTQAACVVTQGLSKRTDSHERILYKDNIFISNICNIRFGDYYGSGSHHVFENCKFIRAGNLREYRTFLWDTNAPCKNHHLINPSFGGEASLSFMDLKSGDHDITVSWPVTVKGAPRRNIYVKDVDGNVLFEKMADEKGDCSFVLRQYKLATGNVRNSFEYIIEVSTDDGVRSKKVSVDGPLMIRL